MTAKLIEFREGAREKVCAGLDILARAVKVTLGPKGRLVMLGRPYGTPTVINSGVIVAKEIELEDPFENLGAQMAREVASRTSEAAGDGTTTATLLARAMVKEGMKYVAAGHDPTDLKRGIDLAVDAVVAELKRNSRPCASSQAMAQVGTISANGDASIGEMIAQAMEKVGENGVLDTLHPGTLAQAAGVKIVCRAVEEPLRQIVANTGGESAIVAGRVDAGDGSFGYNAATERYGDTVAMGVIDPTKVTPLGLQNAASIAGLILTTDCVIVEKPKATVAGETAALA
jgi:chaperonin GroEL (HSP60 family)